MPFAIFFANFSLETLLVKQMQKHLLKSEEHLINNKLDLQYTFTDSHTQISGRLKIDPTDWNDCHSDGL